MTDDTTLSQDEINDLISGGSPVDDLESGIDGSGLLDSLTGKSSLGSDPNKKKYEPFSAK